MSKRQERQRFLRYYKEQTGETELDMQKVAAFAQSKGMEMPRPPSAIDLLAKMFADDARAETRYDEVTRKPYRAYQAVPQQTGQLNLFYYVDIDDASRIQMLKSSVHRREQMVSDGLQLTFDMEHWNRVHPDEEPISLPMDISPDIEWRKAADADDDDMVA